MKQLKITVSTTNRKEESLSRYLNDISKIPMISIDEEIELAQKIHKGGLEGECAKNKLVTANLRFVVSVAKQYQCNDISLIDLINEGNIGLIKAAERFDETRGFKFISYAIWWIRQSIIQAISEKSNIIRLPSQCIMLQNRINKFMNDFEQSNGRKPSNYEIAEKLNIKESEIINNKTISADTPLEDENTTLFDILPSEKEKDQESLIIDLNIVLQNILNSKELFIIKNLFGIGCNAITEEELGNKINLSRERVRQLKIKIIHKLSDSSNATTILRKYVA